MKNILVCLIGLLVSAAAAFGGDAELGIRAYLAQNGLDPAVFGQRGGPAQLLVVNGEPELRWLRHKLRNVPAPSLDALPGPEEAQAILDAWEAGEDEKLQNAKSQDQKILENEYFALVEEIYDAADEEAPDLETAKNLGQARAKIAKARQNKSGTGPGGEQTVDDVLEFLDMQMRLQGLDLELREYDLNWRGNAKKHELE